MATTDDDPFELPKIRVSFGFENDTKHLDGEATAEIWDVKFCPYQPLDQNPVFAAISRRHIVLCRLSRDPAASNPCQVISVIRDEDTDASSCCCTWTKDPRTGAPLLCTGGVGAIVKIYDVLAGKLWNCYVGHGGDVNDLATSPENPSIIASASDDTTVRIWSLDPVHSDQPCLCILGGQGHFGGLLSVAFHDTGNYLLSGGHDQIINMWTIPDLPKEAVEHPLQIHYPHFSSSTLHSGIVDCVAFYGDMILSRACHDNDIVLWSIVGFSSSDPPPSQDTAPVSFAINPEKLASLSHFTRSAFVPEVSPECPFQYIRLLSFSTPGCGPQFFMRFKLHLVPGHNPVLAFCNTMGQICFWDLQRLPKWREMMLELNDPARDKSQPFKFPAWVKPGSKVRGGASALPPQTQGVRGSQRSVNDKDNTASEPVVQPDSTVSGGLAGASANGQNGSAQGKIAGTNAHTNGNVEPGRRQKQKQNIRQPGDIDLKADLVESWAARYSMEDPHDAIKVHRTEPSSNNVLGRQVAWSPSGEWCVAVGSMNQVVIMQRWKPKAPAKGAKVDAKE